MASEGAPSVNFVPPIVIYDAALATARYATGSVLTNATPQHVAIVDGDGTQLTNFIGGVAAGGNLIFNSTDLDESEEQVKGIAGTIYSIYVWNTTADVLWLKAFNATAASVTVGSTSANYDVMIPANANSDGAGFVIPIPTGGWPFSTAITLAITTGVGVTNAGAPGANAAGVLVFFV